MPEAKEGVVDCKCCHKPNIGWAFTCFYCGHDLFDETAVEPDDRFAHAA